MGSCVNHYCEVGLFISLLPISHCILKSTRFVLLFSFDYMYVICAYFTRTSLLTCFHARNRFEPRLCINAYFIRIHRHFHLVLMIVARCALPNVKQQCHVDLSILLQATQPCLFEINIIFFLFWLLSQDLTIYAYFTRKQPHF